MIESKLLSWVLGVFQAFLGSPIIDSFRPRFAEWCLWALVGLEFQPPDEVLMNGLLDLVSFVGDIGMVIPCFDKSF